MTGCRPPPSGRNTSARSTTPSSISTGTSQSICMPSRICENIPDPIPYVMDAQGHIVDLTMMEAAFLTGEDFERLHCRAHRLETLPRHRQRNLLVSLAVHEEEGAFHPLHYPVEPEAFQLLERRGRAVHPEDPFQVLGRYREREHFPRGQIFQAPLPDLVVIPLRAPGDAAGEARLQ